ncbi:hypothetical protein WA026_011045 [Henosepilachna vigintioctopunctata]|uniref:Uncharacterized protein n=1 Tax=Henosepilachna vigintioctopunctata TaxID=420089 RepID=A0AAW1TZ62_9CUCU
MDESEDISTAVYQSNWHLAEPKSRRYLWMMMMRSQKPLGLSIGPIGSVNLNAFIQVCLL